MATLYETSTWVDGIYQLELEDFVEGGADGTSNVQAKQLANRTSYLKQQMNGIAEDVLTTKKMVAANGEFVLTKFAEIVDYAETKISPVILPLTDTEIDTLFTNA